MFMKLLQILIGLLQCKRGYISLRGIRCGTLYHGLRIDQSLAPSGCFKTSWMISEKSLGIRSGWWFKGTIKKRELTIYEETFAPIARIEVICILVPFAAHMKIKLYQIDVKSAFHNRYLEGKVYVMQPPDFENHEFPNHVLNLTKYFMV